MQKNLKTLKTINCCQKTDTGKILYSWKLLLKCSKWLSEYGGIYFESPRWRVKTQIGRFQHHHHEHYAYGRRIAGKAKRVSHYVPLALSSEVIIFRDTQTDRHSIIIYISLSGFWIFAHLANVD